MTKNELIDQIAGKSGFSKADANCALNAVTETIAEALKKGSPVPLIGFGAFEVRERASSSTRNRQDRNRRQCIRALWPHQKRRA